MKFYETPELKLLLIATDDIVRTSPGTNSGADGNQPDGDWWD